MDLERKLRIARKFLTRPETENEAIKRTLADSEARQDFEGAVERGHIEPDDYPNAHFIRRRRLNIPFRRQRDEAKFDISDIVEIPEDPQKDN